MALVPMEPVCTEPNQDADFGASLRSPKLLEHTRQVYVFVSGGFIKRTCLIASGVRKEG